jgi:hypothetical protein
MNGQTWLKVIDRKRRCCEVPRELEETGSKGFDQQPKIDQLAMCLQAGIGELRVQKRLWSELIKTEENAHGPGSFRLGELAMGSIDQILVLIETRAPVNIRTPPDF